MSTYLNRVTWRGGLRYPLSIWLLAWFFIPAALAIDPNRTMSQYVRDRWGPENGFPRGPVYSFAQTTDGYLWIGTEKGLVRFDGVSFELMPSTTSDGTALSHVLGLVADADGSLWVRLRRPTLLHYDKGALQDVMGIFGRPRAAVAVVARALNGGPLLWVLEAEPSAIDVRGKQFETLARPSEFSRSAVLALVQTSDGDIWVGTRDAGLFRLSGKRTVAISQGLPDLKVNALVAVEKNQLWVGTDSGIARWDGTKLTRAGIPHSLDGVQALAMTVDHDSNLWIGTNSQGLVRLDVHGVATFSVPNSSVKGAVTAVFEDREGDLWVGSEGALERLRDSSFVTYSHPEGLPSDGNNPVFVDSENRVWSPPAAGGLWWLKDGKNRSIVTDGLDRDVVYSIAGRNGEVWLGRQRGGLTRLRFVHGAFAAKTFTAADGLVQNSVYSVYQTREGSVWAGTLSGGVSKLDGGRFTSYTVANGLVSNTINAILETSDGTMWFATPDGLSSFSKGKWESITAGSGLPSKDVDCLFEDSSGVLWIGTAAGLTVRSAAGFTAPPAIPASLRDQILGIAEDGFGSLWVATASHVLQVNRQGLLRGALRDGAVREYGLADGLRGVEGVKRTQSVVRDPQGRVWFSLNRGVSVVDPARVRRDSVPAIPQVQSMSADGRPIGLQRAVRIPGGRQRISFGYSGLSLAVPERVRFRYQLDGFDRRWSDPLAAREAVYTNLPPGSYRFRLVASNPDGVWSDVEASVPFEIQPSYWQTWWFRLSCLTACGLTVLFVYRVRLLQATNSLQQRFEERLAERTRIAQELHDTLLQGFVSASMQVHVAASRLPADSQAEATLTRAIQMMGQVIEEGRNTVRGLRSTSTSSLDLERAFSRVQEELATDDQPAEAVKFRVVVEGQPRPLHPLLRDEAYRIGREALINAFRHAHANSVELQLKYSYRRFRILIRDDGRGIDPQVGGVGHDGHRGLSGMRERADRIGSKLRVSSGSGVGTEVELSVPSHVAFQNHRDPALRWFGRRLRRRARNQKSKAEIGEETNEQ